MENKNKALAAINAYIMENIKNGVGNWISKSVKVGNKYLNKPVNYVTGYEYTGINKLMLPSGFYVTYKQLKSIGGNLKKNEDGSFPKPYTIVNCWNKVFVKFTQKQEDGSLKEIIMTKSQFEREQPEYEEMLYEWTKVSYGYDRIYSLNDCENYKKIEHEKALSKCGNPLTTPSSNRDKLCDYFVKFYAENQGIGLYENDSQSFYDSENDAVHIKNINTFKDANTYYEQVFHELSHSTGAESRLNRKFATKVDNIYAKEEVVAELSAMYCLRRMGLMTNAQMENCTEYLKSWLAQPDLVKEMENDKSILIKVFNAADRAQNFIFTRKPKEN